MNNTPRVLNRILIGILGIILLAIGVLLVLLASVPAVGVWWHDWAGGVLNIWLDLFERTQFPSRQGSWLWLVICFVLVVVLGLMVAWIAQQGKGRTSLLVAEEDPGGVVHAPTTPAVDTWIRTSGIGHGPISCSSRRTASRTASGRSGTPEVGRTLTMTRFRETTTITCS